MLRMMTLVIRLDRNLMNVLNWSWIHMIRGWWWWWCYSRWLWQYIVGRVVYEVTLTNSIRYANNDAIEQWLYDLLCLDVTDLAPLTGGTPDPASCDLYYINRDTLFSYDRSAEMFLKHLVNLYVSSHYKVSVSCLYMPVVICWNMRLTRNVCKLFICFW